MQKFHDLLEDFLINRRVVCCLCLGKQTSYIVHRALKQVEGLSSRVLVSSVLSVWLHSFRFEL